MKPHTHLTLAANTAAWLILASVSCFALTNVYVNPDPHDADKLHDAGNWTVNWFNDVNDNLMWDWNEPYADSFQSGWTRPMWASDKSCWMASAANMLAGAGFEGGNETVIYQEILSLKEWPWTREGFQHEALQWYLDTHNANDLWEVKWYAPSDYVVEFPLLEGADPWPNNPFGFAQEELFRGQEVGLMLYGEMNHAVTFQGWDNLLSLTYITDSDADKNLPEDVDVYNTSSSNEAWELTDYAGYNEIYYIVTLCPVPEPSAAYLMSIGVLFILSRRLLASRGKKGCIP